MIYLQIIVWYAIITIVRRHYARFMKICRGREVQLIRETCIYTTGMLIRRFRIRAGKSQRELALEIDVSETTLSRWETDTSKPSPAHLRDLETALGAPVRPGYYDPDRWESPQDAPQMVMNAGVLRSLKAEVEALNTHIQLLSKFVGRMDPESLER